MKLTNNKIKHLAELSAIEIKEEEYPFYIEALDEITDFVSQITKIDIETEFSFDNIIDMNDLREDVTTPSLSNEMVLLNAPKKTKGAFAVPLMMD